MLQPSKKYEKDQKQSINHPNGEKDKANLKRKKHQPRMK